MRQAEVFYAKEGRNLSSGYVIGLVYASRAGVGGSIFSWLAKASALFCTHAVRAIKLPIWAPIVWRRCVGSTPMPHTKIKLKKRPRINLSAGAFLSRLAQHRLSNVIGVNPIIAAQYQPRFLR